MKYLLKMIAPPFTFSSFAVALFTFAFTIGAAGNMMEKRKKIYNRNCMECHGTDGMGILAPPFVESDRFKSMDGVVALIDYSMPATSPDLCTGTSAEDVTSYIIEEYKFQVPTDVLDPEGITDARGRQILFDRTCSICHGEDGKGGLARPIVKSTLFKNKEDVLKFIDGLMPFHNPKKCKNACATITGQYIIDNFELSLSKQ